MQNTILVMLASALLLSGVAVWSRWWSNYGGGKQRRDIEARRKIEREASARARGWTYDGLIEGDIHYRIRGVSAGGVAWCIHYDADHSSSSSTPKLVFLAHSPRVETYVWTLHDRKAFELVQLAAVRAIVGALARLAGAFSPGVRRKAAFYIDAVALPVGRSAFRARYVLAATDARWTGLVDETVERLVTNWPFFVGTMSDHDNCFSASLSDAGLKVQLYCDAPDFAVIAHLSTLGQQLVANSMRMQSVIAQDLAPAMVPSLPTGNRDTPPHAV